MRSLAAILLLLFAACERPVVARRGPAPTVLWKVTGFVGWARPGVDGQAVFVLDTSRTVRSFTKSDGAPRWQRQLPQPSGHRLYSDVVVVGDKVVVADGDLYGLDALSGTLAWAFSTPAGVGSYTLSADQATVYAGAYALKMNGQVTAVDAATGTPRWSSYVIPPDSVYRAGETVRVQGPKVSGTRVFASFFWFRNGEPLARGGIAAFDAATGTLLWSRMLPVPSANKATFPVEPAAAGSVVVVSSEDGNVYALNQGDGSTRWVVPPSDGIYAEARVVGTDGQVVIVPSAALGNIVAAFDAATGAKLWQTKHAFGAVFEHIIIGSGVVVTYHFGGNMGAMDLATGRILWQLLLTLEGFAEPRLYQGVLYAPSEYGLKALKVP